MYLLWGVKSLSISIVCRTCALFVYKNRQIPVLLRERQQEVTSEFYFTWHTPNRSWQLQPSSVARDVWWWKGRRNLQSRHLCLGPRHKIERFHPDWWSWRRTLGIAQSQSQKLKTCKTYQSSNQAVGARHIQGLLFICYSNRVGVWLSFPAEVWLESSIFF